MSRTHVWILLVGMTGLAAACSSKNNSDDDDDGGDSGDAGSDGSSAKGGSANGGTSGSSSKGGTSSSGGSSGTLGSGGSSGSGSSFLNDCLDVCNEASLCPQADPSGSCSDGCSQFNALVTGNICKAQVLAFYDCGATTPDICSDTACETEGYALVICLSDYCTNNSSAAICQPTDG